MDAMRLDWNIFAALLPRGSGAPWGRGVDVKPSVLANSFEPFPKPDLASFRVPITAYGAYLSLKRKQADDCISHQCAQNKGEEIPTTLGS